MKGKKKTTNQTKPPQHHLLIAELIIEFQKIFHDLQEGCFVQASQHADYLATEALYCCLKLDLRLAISSLYIKMEHTGEGDRTQVWSGMSPLFPSAELPL